jgi:hypothetical protein
MARDTRHAVWQVYDEYRTARLNAKYYGVLLERARRGNLLMESLIALAASSSAISGWGLWQTPSGRTLWSLLAGTAAVLAILKPLLRQTERVQRLQEVVGGYLVLDHDLHVLEMSIAQRGLYDGDRVNDFNAAMKRKSDLLTKDQGGSTDRALLRRCMEEVNGELPAERFWVPGENR